MSTIKLIKRNMDNPRFPNYYIIFLDDYVLGIETEFLVAHTKYYELVASFHNIKTEFNDTTDKIIYEHTPNEGVQT